LASDAPAAQASADPIARLRHTAATLVVEADYLTKLVQEALGHTLMAITAVVYSHILPAYRREAVSALAAHLERARTKQVQTEEEVS
jgi:integrase